MAAASARTIALLALLLATAVRAFVSHPASQTPLRERGVLELNGVVRTRTSSSSSLQLKMSDKPEIDVVSQPDKDFLEKKG